MVGMSRRFNFHEKIRRGMTMAEIASEAHISQHECQQIMNGNSSVEKRKFWTPERDSELVFHVDEGLRYIEIAEEMGVTKNAVSGRIKRIRDMEVQPAPYVPPAPVTVKPNPEFALPKSTFSGQCEGIENGKRCRYTRQPGRDKCGQCISANYVLERVES